MGQKVNPIGLRLGINRTWDSRWFADGKDYGRLLHEDVKLRETLKDRLKSAGISSIDTERAANANIYQGRAILFEPGGRFRWVG